MWSVRYLAAALATIMMAAQVQPSAANSSSEPVVEVVVPRAVIYPGDHITAELLKTVSVAIKSVPVRSVFTSVDMLDGMVARRTLVAGQPISRDALRSPTVVQLGQSVAVHYAAGPVSIVLTATAIQAGGVGDTISVRNLDTGRIVRAVIRTDRTLHVTGP